MKFKKESYDREWYIKSPRTKEIRKEKKLNEEQEKEKEDVVKEKIIRALASVFTKTILAYHRNNPEQTRPQDPTPFDSSYIAAINIYSY